MVQPRLVLVGLLVCLLLGCGSGDDEPRPLPVGIVLPRVGTLGREPGGPGTIVVDVTAEGRISVDGKGPLGLVQLRDDLIRLTKGKTWRESDGSSLKILHVRADRDLPWSVSQWIMQVAADPRIQLYRMFFGARAVDSGRPGALGWKLPKGGSIGPVDFTEPPPYLRVRMEGHDGEASEPEDLVPALRAAAGKHPLSTLRLDLAGPRSNQGDVPTGFVVRVVDVALRAGVRDIEFQGRMPQPAAAAVEGLLDHVEEARRTMGAPRLLVGRSAVPSRPRSEPIPASDGRRKILLGIGVETTEPGPGVPEDRASGSADAALEEELEETEPFTVPPSDGRLPAIDTYGAFASRMRGGGPREDAVERALTWLAAQQRQDGGWTATGRAFSDVGVTGLAVSAFLGAGYRNRGKHPYARTVSRGLRYLKNVQEAEGGFGKADAESSAVDHAVATLAMVEAYGMTRSPIFKGAAQRSLDHLLRDDAGVQGADGAAFVVMPLLSARHVNDAAVEHDRRPPLGLGGEAKLRDRLTRLAQDVRAAADTTERVARAWLGVLVHETLPRALPVDPQKGDPTYWHFGALVAHQVGGETWKRWEKALDSAVRDRQHTDKDVSDLLGSWDPAGGGDRTVTTALLAMALEAPYRYARRR